MTITYYKRYLFAQLEITVAIGDMMKILPGVTVRREGAAWVEMDVMNADSEEAIRHLVFSPKAGDHYYGSIEDFRNNVIVNGGLEKYPEIWGPLFED